MKLNKYEWKRVRAGTGLVITFFFLACAAMCQARMVTVSTYPQLRDACRNARPGDEIVVAPGIYHIANASRLQITNRPGPIMVRGASGKPGDVIVEGDGQDTDTVLVAFDLDDCPQWTFRDLTTRRTYYHGFKFDGGSTDCTLQNVVMRDHGESGIKGTSDPKAGRYPDRLRVVGCNIGFTKTTGGTRSVVEGIDGVGVNGWTIRHTRFINIQKGGKPAYGAFTKGNSSDTTIDDCRFDNCFIGASFGGGGTDPAFFRLHDLSWEHQGGSITNCTFVNMTDAAVYINKGRNCRIENNHLFRCGLNIQLRYAASSGIVRGNWVANRPDQPEEPPVRVRDGAGLLVNTDNLCDNKLMAPTEPE